MSTKEFVAELLETVAAFCATRPASLPNNAGTEESAPRAVAMRLVLFREYLASLDRWALGRAAW